MAVRRRWWRLGGLVSVALLAGGTYLAVDGYTSTEGPGDAVRGYFAALADSDAPTALAYGSVPSGSDSLLTSAVLREQNRIAALRDVTIGATTRTGSHATVTVRYTLAFPGHPQTLSAQVGVHKAGDDWRLDTIAVATQIELLGAQDRASILGTAIPEGTTLLFPGVVPVRFDTPYLALAPAASAVTFGAQPTTQVSVQASPAGRQAALAWAAGALRGCVAAHPDPACPQPDDRYVPGSLHGALIGTPASGLTVTVDNSPQGWLLIGGTQSVQASSYQRLDFENRPVSGHGRVSLQVSARAYPVAPLHFAWTAT